MKKHHKMLSVGGAVLAVLVIAFLYKRNSKEGMGTARAAARVSPGEKGIIDRIIEFFTFAWLLELLGLSKSDARAGAVPPAVAARDRATAAVRAPKRTPPSPRGATGGRPARGPAGVGQARPPAAKRPAPKRPAPKRPAGKRPTGAPPAGAPPAPAGGAESFTTMQRGGAWRPRGSIAPM